MMAKSKLVIVSFSPVARDPRVMRQIEVLADSYELIVIGFGDAPDRKDIQFIPVHSTVSRSVSRKLRWAFDLLCGRFDSYYWNLPWALQTKRILEQIRPNALIANDIDALPVALSVNAPVLYDAHEYAPRQFEDRLRWRIFFQRYKHYLCEFYLDRVSSMTTVCAGIRDEYERCFGVSSRVVHNTPYWQQPSYRPVNGSRINIIHHGVANRSRRLEQMIDMVDHLDERYHLDMMLVGEGAYVDSLKKRASHNKRVKFISPVPMKDICRKLSEYDIGLFLLAPVNFNYMHALPNKFFEFIQAGLAVAIGPSPEMKLIAEKYRLGVVSDAFDPIGLADKLNNLSAEDIGRLKEASVSASEVLGFEMDAQVIRQEISRIMRLASEGRKISI